MFVLIPPLAPAPKRKMHQALFVPEILLAIFKHVTDDSGKPLLPTLAALSRTCRTFQRQADIILWYKLPNVSALYNILPPRVRNRESRSWSLSRRMFSGSDWTRFLNRASRVRVLVENANSVDGQYDRCSAIYLAMVSILRDPPLLTPSLRKLEWKTSQLSLCSAINLFIGPSLLSLEIDAKLLINHVIRVPLGDICPRLEHIKIAGNGRCSAGTISRALRGLHFLETVACSTLDNDAFVHLSQLKNLSYLAVDMRWSPLSFDALRGHLPPGSFHSLQILHWKDYRLDLLSDIFLVPDISPSNIHLEIESFCTSSSLRSFLCSFATKFPRTRSFSLVHDTGAGRRFGLQAGSPGREHQLDALDLTPLLALKFLRVLNLVDLGRVRPDDDLVKAIATTSPELEQFDLRTDVAEPTPPSVTFDGLLSLLQHCPKLRSLGMCIDAENMLSFEDTTVRHDCLKHLRLEGRILGSQHRAEVDAMLGRVLPGLRTVEESPDGVTWHTHEVDASRTSPPSAGLGGGRRITGRRTLKSGPAGAR